MRRAPQFVTALVVLSMAAVAAAPAYANEEIHPENHPIEAYTADDPPVEVDAGCEPVHDAGNGFCFTRWGRGIGALNTEGPWTFSATIPTKVIVTDLGCEGDILRLVDNGVVIGDTSSVPFSQACQHAVGTDVAAAIASPHISSGFFCLAAGSHSMQFRAMQNPFNSGAGAFKVTSDRTGCNTPPVITAPDMNVEATTVGGAHVAYTDLVVTDAEDDPAPTAICDRASGTFFPLGQTTVTCTATDSDGDSDTASFIVTVADTTAPTLHDVPEGISVWATSARGATVSFTSPWATDVADAAPSVSCSRGPGAFAPGLTRVACRASDASGNVAEATFDVAVSFQFVGFLSPVSMTDSNALRAGASVPIKWRIPDQSGGYISELSVVDMATSGTTACSVEVRVISLTETNTGQTELRYDFSDNQYIYNWKSPAGSGACYKVTIRLIDGNSYSAEFRLR